MIHAVNFTQISIIISAETSYLSAPVNRQRHSELERRLRTTELQILKVEGCCKGAIGKSVLLPGIGLLDVIYIKSLLSYYDQESALVLIPYERGDNSPAAFLCPTEDLLRSTIQVYEATMEAHPHYIGRFRSVSKLAAERMDSYSLINGIYYAAIKEPWEVDENPEFVG